LGRKDVILIVALKGMKTFFSVVVAIALLAACFPSQASADRSACTPNFSTKPMVAGGGTHSIALKSDGTVWSWGDNHNGELGNGSYEVSMYPVRAQGLCDVVAVAGGWWHTLALKSDGTVWAWGGNQYGQLGKPGVGNDIRSTVPVQVMGLSDVIAIAAGSYHNAVLKNDGTVWTWGINTKGELGYATEPGPFGNYYLPSYEPKAVSGLTGVKAIGAGFGISNDNAYTAALKQDGTVWTWGSNQAGQLGYATADDYAPHPIPGQVSSLTDVASISLGATHALALTATGTVFAWGANEEAQLGIGSFGANSSGFVRHPSDNNQLFGGVASIRTRGSHSLAQLTDGTIWSWGRNYEGQVGNGTQEKQLVPIKPELNGTFVTFGAGSSHSLAVKDDGTVWTWGMNSRGQLGYDTSTPEEPGFYLPSLTPQQIARFNVKETALSPSVSLVGKPQVYYPEWSSATRISAIIDNPGSELTQVTLKLIPDNGLSLVENDAIQTIDRIPGGASAATTWKVRAASEGNYSLTVLAYQGNDQVPFDTAFLQFEAVASLVPSAVGLEGLVGVKQDGTPVAARSSTLTFNVSVPCQDVSLTITDSNGKKVVFDNESPTAAVFSFVPFDVGPLTSLITVKIEAPCLSQPITFPIQLIDPSGIVYHAGKGLDWALPDATVVLEKLEVGREQAYWVEMSEEAYPGQMSPITNPQITGKDGRYAWDVAAGIYRVQVSRPGFVSAKSVAVTVPPPVTDLHVSLTPTDTTVPSLMITGAADNGTYTQAVKLQVQATDDASGVRQVKYRLDQGAEQTLNGASGSVTVTAVGAHVVDFTVIDHAGNEAFKSIAFTIKASGGGSNPGGGNNGGGGTGFVGGGGGTQGTAAPLSILIDGKAFDRIAAVVASQVNGAVLQMVTLNTAALLEQLAKAGDKPEIVVPVSAGADKVTLTLDGDAVKAAANKQAVLELRTPFGSYKLPMAELKIDSLAKQWGDQAKLHDLKVQVSIAKSGAGVVGMVQDAAAKNRFSIVAPPVDFAVTASYNSQTVKIDAFDKYVTRELPILAGTVSSHAVTALMLEADGTVHHVPTSFIVQDGVQVANVHSLTNGTFFIVSGSKVFSDTNGHWAESIIADMASRMIVSGDELAHYRPDAAVTRAEFVAMLVRALGLGNSGATSAFTDVDLEDWYMSAVSKAHVVGLVQGYDDRTFRPNDAIARQEAFAMIERAMKLAGLDTSIGDAETGTELSKFMDGGEVAGWARKVVAAVIESGIVSGSEGKLLPAEAISRAETAVIVMRMLEKAKLIAEVGSGTQ